MNMSKGTDVCVISSHEKWGKLYMYASHLDEEVTFRSATRCLFWPQISTEVEHQSRIVICVAHDINQHKETMVPVEQPIDKHDFQK